MVNKEEKDAARNNKIRQQTDERTNRLNTLTEKARIKAEEEEIKRLRGPSRSSLILSGAGAGLSKISGGLSKGTDKLWPAVLFLIFLFVIASFVRGTFWMWPVGIAIAVVALKIVGEFIPEWLRKFFVKSFKFVVAALVIILLISFFRSGTESGIGRLAVIAIEESGLQQAITVVKDAATGLWNKPEQFFYDYSNFDNPDAAEETESKGITFSNVRPRRTEFEEGMPLIVDGNIDVTALPEDTTTVTFYCEINNTDFKFKQPAVTDLTDIGETKDVIKKGNLALKGLNGNSITVYEGRDEYLSFTCELDGIELNLDNKQRNDGTRDIRTYVVRVWGVYEDFTTESIIGIYNMNKEELDKKRFSGEFVFEYVDDPQLDKDEKTNTGKTNPVCVSGCGLTRLSLKSDIQPQTVGFPYTLGMGLQKDSDYYGSIAKVKRIELVLPSENFKLVSCQDFNGDNVLDENDPYLEQLNKNIQEKKYGDDSNNPFYCEYEIFRSKDTITRSEILATATYDYYVEQKKGINVIERVSNTISNGQTNNQDTETDNFEGYTEAEYVTIT